MFSIYCRFEKRDFILATIALIAIFTIVLYRWGYNVKDLRVLLGIALGVSTGFLLHELAHREIARRLGYIACFKAWTLGLLIAIMLSITGIVIAAPGAVYVGPKIGWRFIIDKERLRKDEFYIALAGPLTNIIFAIISMILLMVKPLAITFGIVFTINASLAFFNLLPLPMLDGFKVAKGNLIVWIFLFLIALIMFFGMIILR